MNGIFLTLSCLQGRPMYQAARELLSLEGVTGLQLTPGNVPTHRFEDFLHQEQIPHFFHEGFSWQSLRQQVWDSSYALRVPPRSVHPPRWPDNRAEQDALRAAILAHPEYVYEVMYPPYFLGDTDSLRWAMEHQVSLALDISHAHILHRRYQLPTHLLDALLDYPHLAEIHVSDNAGDRDSHRCLTPDSFLLKELKHLRHLPWMFEAYLHKVPPAVRQEQIHLLEACARG